MSGNLATQTAWAYLVVSSEQQAETLEHQQAWADDLAGTNKWQITKAFKGVSSGRDGTRGLLEELLVELRKTASDQRPDRVMMIRLDRLGRGLGFEALAAIAEISRLGVKIHTRQDGDYSLARASDSILPMMRVVTGAIENEARRDKAKAVYSRRRAANLVVGNKRPYGLILHDGRDTAQEPQAQVVRLAFELAVNGYGLAAIGARIRPISPPKLYVNGRTHETEWTNNRVAKLLKNRSYRGVLVNEQIWDNVQSLRAGSVVTRTNSKHPWPLSGAVHCTCGRILIGSILGSPPRRVYRCCAKQVHGKNVICSALKLERLFEDLLKRLSVTPSLEAAASASTIQASTEFLKTKLDSLNAAIERQAHERQRAWTLNERGLIHDAELSRRLKEIDADVAIMNRDAAAVLSELTALNHRRENTLQAKRLIENARGPLATR